MRMRRVLPYTYHALLAAFMIVWIYPFVWMISSSFKTNSEYLSGSLTLIPNQLNLDNYIRAWDAANFSVYFFNTVIITLSTVAIVIFTCALTGYALGRYTFRGRKLFIVAVTATLFMPKGFTIIPIYTLIRTIGLDNTLLGVILAEAGGAHVLFILLFMAYFHGLPKALGEAAEIDGCGFFRTFAQVMLPLAKPIIATTAILQFMESWNSFLIPLVLTLRTPHLQTLGVGMFQFVGEQSVDYTGLAAAASISLIPVIVVFILFQRYFIEGVAGAVKG